MSTSLKRTGLLWGLTLTLLANLVQAGNIKQGGNDGSVTTDSSLTLTERRSPVNQARVRIFSPDGTRMYSGVCKTDKDGYTTISLPEGLEFKLEIKIGPDIYFTEVYTAPAQIKFDPFNTAPVATDLSYSTGAQTAVAVTLEATDAENDPLTFTYTQPANGTLTGTAPNLTYTPNAGFYGDDSFTYKADDGIALSNTANVTISVAAPFIITVNATDGTFLLPLQPGLAYDFIASYDGTTTTHTSDANLTITFPSGPGVYDIAISGTFPAICMDNSGVKIKYDTNRPKLIDIKQWGSIEWQTMESAFVGCNNLQVSATDIPNLSNVTSMLRMFNQCRGLTSLNVTNWDVSNVTTMKWAFHTTGLETLDVSTWDTGSVESFYRTFAYNQKLKLVGYENWDVSNVVEFMGTFQGNRGMTSIDISNWNTSDKLINLRRTFAGTNMTEIKGLGNLNVTKLEYMERIVPEDYAFSTEEYDAILTGWANQVTGPANGFLSFIARNSKYTPFSPAAAAREKLIALNWRITDAGTVAGINPFTTTSITSPIRISGWKDLETDTMTSTVGGSAQPLTKWGDTLWYTDVALDPAQALPFTVSYNGDVVKSGDLVWQPTLIDTTSSQFVTIRKGHSLLLGSAVKTGTTLEIDTDGDGTFDLSGAPTDLFPVQYPEYGTFEVATRIDGTDVGLLVVTVPEILFPQSVACEIGYTRELTVGVPEDNAGNISFSALNDTELQVTVADELTLPGTVKLFIKPLRSGSPTILATNSTTGDPLETKVVDEFDLSSQADKFIGVVDEFEDGSLLLRTNLYMLPKVPELDVVLDIFKAGVTFSDSTMVKTVNTTDFALDTESGLYLHPYELIIPTESWGGPCHTIKVYQDGIQVGK